jgi:hypothetical protein
MAVNIAVSIRGAGESIVPKNSLDAASQKFNGSWPNVGWIKNSRT